MLSPLEVVIVPLVVSLPADPTCLRIPLSSPALPIHTVLGPLEALGEIVLAVGVPVAYVLHTPLPPSPNIVGRLRGSVVCRAVSSSGESTWGDHALCDLRTRALLLMDLAAHGVELACLTVH